jgi:acyl-coenzyme A thioesterase PaaI-like protein
VIDLKTLRPTISSLWARTSRLPMGNRVFSTLIGRAAPYTGTIRPSIRNHLRSVHAIALMNLGEVATGLAVMHAVDGRGRGIVTGLRMEYVKKARGTITATCDEAVPLSPGTHDLEVAGELRDGAGDVVARMWATWRVEITG